MNIHSSTTQIYSSFTSHLADANPPFQALEFLQHPSQATRDPVMGGRSPLQGRATLVVPSEGSQ